MTSGTSSKSAPRSERQRSQRSDAGGGQRQRPDPRKTTIALPFASLELRWPEQVPGSAEVGKAADSVREYLPPPRQAAYYTGLGVLGLLEVIEWPVVLAIGVGTALAGQTRPEAEQRPERSEAEEPAAAPAG